MPTDLALNYGPVYADLKKLTKDALARRLVAEGTIYPTFKDLCRLPKEELIRMAIDNHRAGLA